MSRFQGTVNVDRMKASGVRACMIRAVALDTEGVDSRFAVTAQGCARVGLPWGAYIFMNPKAGGPVFHRMMLERALEPLGILPDLPIMIDCEEYAERPGGGTMPIVYGQAYADQLRGLIGELRRVDPRPPMIYANDSWWNPKIADATFGRYDLVAPRYVRATTSLGTSVPLPPPADPSEWERWAFEHIPAGPELPVGWNTWAAWQFSADGNGIGQHIGTANPACPVDLVHRSTFLRWQLTPR